MFSFNEWEIAGYVSIIIFCLWVIAFILAEIWKYSWAWVDDSKPEKGNFVYNKITKIVKSKWIYPVFLTDMDKPFGYAKDKKWNNAKIHDVANHPGLEKDKDYIYDTDIRVSNVVQKSILPILSIFTPFFVLISIKFYIAGMVIGSLVLTAYLSRFTRRLSKKCKLHAGDKDIHIQPEEKE